MDTLATADVEAAYKLVFPMILAKCTRMLTDASEAHDVAQETFTRLWANRDALTDHRCLTAWLYRTSTRLAIDRLRLRARQEPTDLAGHLAPQLAMHTSEGRLDARGRLAELWRTTPIAELEAAVLRGVDGMTQPEVAEAMGTSERTVRRLLARFQARCPEVPARSR